MQRFLKAMHARAAHEDGRIRVGGRLLTVDGFSLAAAARDFRSSARSSARRRTSRPNRTASSRMRPGADRRERRPGGCAEWLRRRLGQRDERPARQRAGDHRRPDRKRLWPVAALLVAVIVAVPLLIGAASSPGDAARRRHRGRRPAAAGVRARAGDDDAVARRARRQGPRSVLRASAGASDVEGAASRRPERDRERAEAGRDVIGCEADRGAGKGSSPAPKPPARRHRPSAPRAHRQLPTVVRWRGWRRARPPGRSRA